MTESNQSNRVSSSQIWLIAGCYFVLLSFNIQTPLTLNKSDPGPSFLPVICGGIMVCGGVYMLTVRLVSGQQISYRKPLSSTYSRTMLVFSYLVLLPLMGFYFSTFLFGVLSMRQMKVKMIPTLVSALAVVVLVHFVFIVLFGIQLPSPPNLTPYL